MSDESIVLKRSCISKCKYASYCSKYITMISHSAFLDWNLYSRVATITEITSNLKYCFQIQLLLNQMSRDLLGRDKHPFISDG